MSLVMRNSFVGGFTFSKFRLPPLVPPIPRKCFILDSLLSSCFVIVLGFFYTNILKMFNMVQLIDDVGSNVYIDDFIIMLSILVAEK